MSGPDRLPAFDAHVHAGPAEAGDPLAPPPADVLARRLAAAGIERAVVFAPNRRDGYREANQALLAMAAADPERWVPFLRMRCARPHPFGRRARWTSRLGLAGGADEYPVDELVRLLGGGGFRGVKLNPGLDGMPADEALDFLARDRVPVVLHAGEGTDRGEVEGAFLERGIPTVLAHMGTYPLRRSQAAGWLALLDRHACAYVDTSMVFFEHLLLEAIGRFPERVLFGSDAPSVDPSVGRATIDGLPMDEETRRMVLGTNLISLLASRGAAGRAGE